jgi:hypothetical protein
MANQIRIKRGLETNRSGVTPAEGELLYTTDEKKLYVGDGTTVGGNEVGKDSLHSPNFDLNHDIPMYMMYIGNDANKIDLSAQYVSGMVWDQSFPTVDEAIEFMHNNTLSTGTSVNMGVNTLGRWFLVFEDGLVNHTSSAQFTRIQNVKEQIHIASQAGFRVNTPDDSYTSINFTIDFWNCTIFASKCFLQYGGLSINNRSTLYSWNTPRQNTTSYRSTIDDLSCDKISSADIQFFLNGGVFCDHGSYIAITANTTQSIDWYTAFSVSGNSCIVVNDDIVFTSNSYGNIYSTASSSVILEGSIDYSAITVNTPVWDIRDNSQIIYDSSLFTDSTNPVEVKMDNSASAVKNVNQLTYIANFSHKTSRVLNTSGEHFSFNDCGNITIGYPNSGIECTLYAGDGIGIETYGDTFFISDDFTVRGATELYATNIRGEIQLNYSAGTSGQVLTSQGSGADPIWTTPASGGGLNNVVEDTTPQLGGALDLNGNNITGSGNLEIYGTLSYDGIGLSGTPEKVVENRVNGGLAYYWGTGETTDKQLDAYAVNDYHGGKFVISARDVTTGDSQILELLVTSTTTTAIATEYANLYTGDELISVDVEVSTGSVGVVATKVKTTDEIWVSTHSILFASI